MIAARAHAIIIAKEAFPQDDVTHGAIRDIRRGPDMATMNIRKDNKRKESSFNDTVT